MPMPKVVQVWVRYPERFHHERPPGDLMGGPLRRSGPRATLAHPSSANSHSARLRRALLSMAPALREPQAS